MKKLSYADILIAIRRGAADFTREPLFGLFFGGFYALGGILLYLMLAYYRSVWLILPLAIGFPLVGPFVAAGCYEVSRRITSGENLKWSVVLTVMWRQSRREFGWMAFVVLFILWVWMYQVRLLVAFFMGFKGFASIDGFMQSLTLQNGAKFLIIGTALGSILYFVLFASTVISMPMLLHRDVDFVTSLIKSWKTVLANLQPMLLFGVIIAALTFLALVPMFLGLIVVLPILGHSTWRLYEIVETQDGS